MPLFRLVRLACLWCAALALLLAGCGKAREASASSKEPATAPSQLQADDKGVIAMRADAPELKEMTTEAAPSMRLPVDEVIAPAKIEVNPNRVGHAVLPAAGRIVKLMVKLGDAVTQGQPGVVIESPVIADAESGFLQ